MCILGKYLTKTKDEMNIVDRTLITVSVRSVVALIRVLVSEVSPFVS